MIQLKKESMELTCHILVCPSMEPEEQSFADQLEEILTNLATPVQPDPSSLEELLDYEDPFRNILNSILPRI